MWVRGTDPGSSLMQTVLFTADLKSGECPTPSVFLTLMLGQLLLTVFIIFSFWPEEQPEISPGWQGTYLEPGKNVPAE